MTLVPVTEIGFYHLTRTGPDQALPALLGRTLAAGERAVVRTGDEARVAALDEALWASTDPDWLPHGTARTGFAPLQPIWLTASEENPNGARLLFLLDGVECADLLAWTRGCDLFDGRDEAAVAAARRRWTAAKALGAGLAYWQQGERGWVKKGA